MKIFYGLLTSLKTKIIIEDLPGDLVSLRKTTVMNSGLAVLIVSLLLLQIAGGRDLYWQPNSNWGTPSNWALGRVPCGDVASLASVCI